MDNDPIKKVDKDVAREMNSDNFCMLPWMHASVSSNGHIQQCCRQMHVNDLNLNTMTFDEYFLSDENKEIRQMFLDGIWPNECMVCKNIEDNGGNSKRMQENHKYFRRAKDAGFSFDVDSLNPIIFLDVRPSNKCNLKCKMCSEKSSSLIAKELNPNATYTTLNEFAFNQIKKILPTLDELYMLGGETTIVDEVEELIQHLSTLDCMHNIFFRTNINGMVLPDSFLEHLPKFKKAQVDVSIDGYGKVNEYIRFPSKWDKIANNLSKLYDDIYMKYKHCNISVCVAVQSFNILDIKNLLLWLNENYSQIRVNLILLTNPDCYNIYVLPFDVRKRIADELTAVRDQITNIKVINSSLDTLITHLTDDKTSSVENFWKNSNWQDSRRDCSLKEYLPELYDILDGDKYKDFIK